MPVPASAPALPRFSVPLLLGPLTRGKTDAGDAEAICEAVPRPTMRFVAVKTIDQQAALMLHKTRDLLVRQRTMRINAVRGHLAELGFITAKGPSGTKVAIAALHEAQDRLPEVARRALHSLVDQRRLLGEEIDRLEARILEWHRASDVSRRLATIPGIGPITASAIAAAVPDGTLFRSGRQFAAWLGLTPKAHSRGGKQRQAGISKQGDGDLRRLLVVGATAVMRLARQDDAARCWAAKLRERKLAAVALANKTARIAWAVLTRGGPYAAPTAAQARFGSAADQGPAEADGVRVVRRDDQAVRPGIGQTHGDQAPESALR